MTKSDVSAPQFFSLLFLSTLGSVFMYTSSSKITIASTDTLFRPLVFALFSIVVAIPMYFVCKSETFKKHISGEEQGIAYKVIFVIYALVYIADALMTAARFDLFASSELFPGTEMTAFIIGLVVVCVMLSFSGIGALGRASTIFTLIVIGATVFASFTLSKELDFLNFTPLFENGVGKFFSDSLMFCIQASEIGAIVMFSTQIKGDLKKNYVLWSLLSAVTFSFVLFFVIGTLGVFADTQLFPTYSAVSLAEFGLFERLDALETAIWILCIVAKLTFYFIVVTKCICFAFGKLKGTWVAIGVGALISLVLIFVSGNVLNFGFITYTPLIVGVYVVPVVVLPCILLLINFTKRRKNSEKTV